MSISPRPDGQTRRSQGMRSRPPEEFVPLPHGPTPLYSGSAVMVVGVDASLADQRTARRWLGTERWSR